MLVKLTPKKSVMPKSGIQKWLKPDRRIRPSSLSTAELAECTCPDFCHRDHGNE
jgi:hypothetical protein